MPTKTLGLVEVLESCQPLLGAATEALRVYPTEDQDGEVYGPRDAERCNEVLAAIGDAHGLTVPLFVADAPDRPSSLEAALSAYCTLKLGSWRPVVDGSGHLPPAAEAGRAVLPGRRRVTAGGAPAFDAYSAGPAGDEATVLVLPSGVPATLFRPWLDELSADRFVITYENPFLFGDWAEQPFPKGDFVEEVDLVGALLGAYGLRRAHLVGICGGAPVALSAAAEFGDRVESLTVLHPDLNYGKEATRTPFQKQFQGILARAASGPGPARETLDLFLDPNMLYGVPPRLAPYILYPYGDVELFHRYAVLNNALMAYDADDASRRIRQRVLIVTSRTDRMTHPETARHFGTLVKGEVTVLERESGDHHDILVPDQEIYTLLRDFMAGTS